MSLVLFLIWFCDFRDSPVLTFNLVLWFQRQPSLDLCLSSVHNCLVFAVCTDWHHPRNCLSGCNPTSQDLWSIFWWIIVLHPELTKASLWLRALLISYVLNTLWKTLGIPLGVGSFPVRLRHWCCGLATGQILSADESSFAELLESAREDSKWKSHCLTVSSLKQSILCQSLVKYFHLAH